MCECDLRFRDDPRASRGSEAGEAPERAQAQACAEAGRARGSWNEGAQAAEERGDRTPLSPPAHSMHWHGRRGRGLCAFSVGVSGGEGAVPNARGWLRAHSALLLLVLLCALAGGGAHGQQLLGLVGRLKEELHQDLLEQGREGSTPAGTSAPFRGTPGDTIQWQRFTNYSQAGFVHYSSYRLGADRVAVVGLCFRDGMRLEWREGRRRMRGRIACSWFDMAQGTVSHGTVELRTSEEPHWEAKLTYDTCILLCTYPKNASVVRHDHQSLMGSGGRGGYLEVEVGPQKFVALAEEEPVEVLPADHVKRLKHQIVFCSAPLFGSLEPRALSQWMDYHLFLLGLDHAFLYNAGGVSLPVLAELGRFLDAGLITVTDFRDQALYSSWSHAQSVAQYDCLFRNRETADWVGFGDFDEYMVDSFPRPRTFRGFLCEQTCWGVAFLSYGNYEFTRECNQTDLWDPSLGRLAVEFPQTRAKYATCYPGERAHPNDCQGRRKFFANPRRVERVYIHSARATSGSVRRGHSLRVQGHVYYNHYRGMTARGQWCNVPGLPAPRWERHEDETWIDLSKNLVRSTAAARVAAATRECLQRQKLPTHFCRQESGEEALPQAQFRDLSDASFVFFSAYHVDARRVALLGLALSGGSVGGMEPPEVPCKPRTRLSCAVQRRGLAAAEGQLTRLSTPHNQTYEYSAAILLCDLPHWITPAFWASNDTNPPAGPGPEVAALSDASQSSSAAGPDAGGSSRSGPQVVVGLGRGSFLLPEMPPVAPPPSDLALLVFCAAPLLPGAPARVLPEWMDYHLFHLGLDHLFLYDAGGLGEGDEGAGAPAVRRFVDAGKLTVVPFRDQRLYPTENDAQDLALHDCLYRSRGRASWVAGGSLEDYWEDRMQPEGSLREYLAGLDPKGTSLVTYSTTVYTTAGNSTAAGGTPAPDCPPGRGPQRKVAWGAWGAAREEAPLVEAFGWRLDTRSCQGGHEARGGHKARRKRRGALGRASGTCATTQGFILNPDLVETSDTQGLAMATLKGEVAKLDPASQLHASRFLGLLQGNPPSCSERIQNGGASPGDPDTRQRKRAGEGEEGEGPGEAVWGIARAARACAAEKGVPSWQCRSP